MVTLRGIFTKRVQPCSRAGSLGGLSLGIENSSGFVESSLSPDGTRLAFVQRDDLWVRDLSSFDAQRISGTLGAMQPFWSPDGYRLVFSSTRDGGKDIYTMMADGTNVERLTSKGSCSNSISSPFRDDLKSL